MGYQTSDKHPNVPPQEHQDFGLPSSSKLHKEAGVSSAAEIPVWINGLQRWISGIGRKTTCDDVIRVLLRAEGVNVSDDRHTKHYAIVERWRKVERPLDGRARILKVWHAWGDEQNAVRLALRRVNPTTPRDVKSSHQRRTSSATPPHYRARLLQTVHPKRLIQQSGDPAALTDGIERLMKLILAQGETIHSQLRRLHERDEQIHRIEHKVHRDRVEKLGSNYLLETYLGSTDKGEEEEKGEDSGVAEVGSGNGSAEVGTSPTEDVERRQRCRTRSRRTTDYDDERPRTRRTATDYVEEEDGAYCAADESSSDEHEAQNALVDLRSCIALFESIIRVNKRLEKQEQYLVKLHVKLRRYSDSDTEKNNIESENVTEEATAIIKEQLEEAVTLSNTQEQQIEANERALMDTKNQLESRHRLLDCLQEELRATEAEGAQLQSWVDAMIRSQHVDAISTRCTVLNKLVDSDSNSDTGLSSLHSSGEEGGYVLDTLV